MSNRWLIGVNEANYAREHKPETQKLEKTLRPCPFCGNKKIELSLIHPQYYSEPNMEYWCYWEILCPECGVNFENGIPLERRADGNGLDYEPEEYPLKHWDKWEKARTEIIEDWNRRVKNEN